MFTSAVFFFYTDCISVGVVLVFAANFGESSNLSTLKMEEDDFDDALASLDIPEMQAVAKTQSSSSQSSLSQKLEASKERVHNKPAEEVQGAAKAKVHNSNAIIVNSKQRGIKNSVNFCWDSYNFKTSGNPILKAINNIPYEFDDSIIPDYVVGTTACVLYLSLR